MSLDLDVQALLRSHLVQEINFRMPEVPRRRHAIAVSGPGFRALSDLFTDRPVRERVRVVVAPEVIGPHALAHYRPSDGNVIAVRSDTVLANPAGQAVVVHECTHAQIDLRGIPTDTRFGEAVAFIAEVWFLLGCVGDNVDKIDPTYAPAIVDIAKDLRRRSRESHGGQAEMTPYQVSVAREIMIQYYHIRSGWYPQNGIWGHFYRGQ